MNAAKLLLAAAVALPPPAVAFLARHVELRVGTAESTACVVITGLAKLTVTLEADLNGDTSQDVAIVVRSLKGPAACGVVPFHASESGPSSEHWVAPLSRIPVAGIGAFKDPFATWVIVGSCPGGATQPYLWTGRRYEKTGIHE
jgi:hypothetical protein